MAPRVALLGLVAAAAAHPDAPEAERTAALLDPQGRAMLEPMRQAGLRPRELIARLSLAGSSVVADIGAGPGFFTLPLAEAVPAGKVIATDLRPDYLAVTRLRAERARADNVTTLLAARDRPGLAPGSVDLALLVQVDHYLPDRAAYLGALAACLRPGGRIALVNYARYRAADLEAARAASLQVVDEWWPSPPFFLLVLGQGPRL